jgi:hypothetical protein
MWLAHTVVKNVCHLVRLYMRYILCNGIQYVIFTWTSFSDYQITFRLSWRSWPRQTFTLAPEPFQGTIQFGSFRSVSPV